MDVQAETNPRYRFAVFLLEGNHLISPHYAYSLTDYHGRSSFDVTAEALVFTSVVRQVTRPEGDAAWLDVDELPDGSLDVASVTVDVTSRVFRHGHATMYCVAGPAFEAAGGTPCSQ